MNLNNLTKSQVVWLSLLITIVTSVVTAIVTVTLMRQTPPPFTQTINRVIEKTIGIPAPIIPSAEENKNNSSAPPNKEDAIVKVVKNISPAVVSVVATKDLPVIEQYFIDPFGDDDFLKDLIPDLKIPQYRQNGTEKKEVASGSGFFISGDGLLLTNRHVVEDKDAEYTIITNDGKKFSVRVLARDPFQDLAVLQIDDKSNPGNFKSATLGDSDSLDVGQTVIAVGNALGEFRNTVSVGIVSGLNRNITAQGAKSGPEDLEGLIQTDAAINPGNSGGPLIDLYGNVVGINTAVAQGGQNIGFALPINLARRDISEAKEFGRIRYPYIGIRYAVREDGLILKSGGDNEPAVELNSPAGKAGLRESDILIMSKADLAKLLNDHRAGDVVTLKIIRGSVKMEVSVTLGERPANI